MKRIYEYEDLQTLIVRSSVYVYRKKGQKMITKDEIQELLHSTETFRVEHTTSN